MFKLIKNLGLGLLAGLFALNTVAWAADCAEWNLAKDFRASPNQENPNRDLCGNLGVWHFMQSADFNRNPQTYSLMQRFTTDFVGVHDFQAWGGTETDSGFVNGYMPSVVTNKRGQVTSTLIPDKIHIHPAPAKLVVVGWRSPINGNVKISGLIVDVDGGGGDGVLWYIDKNTANLASGSLANGASQNIQDGGTIGNSLSNISVNQGDFIYFVVHPNASHYYDTTMLDVTITPVTTCVDTNGSTQTGIDLVKATPANYGLFTQAQIDAAKQTGIQSCKDNPASCGLFNQTQYDAAKQTGIDLVKAKPNDYGITIKSLGGFTQDELNTAKTASIQDGINQCKTNPNSFGLFTQAQLDAAKLAGIQSCKDNPASCGLFNQTQLDAAANTAKLACQTNPSSCGINIGFTQAQLDAAVNSAKQIALQDGINQCKADPNCKGSTNAIHATYNPLNGEVHIPFIDVPNGIGFVQTFDVYLLQRNGSFTFDLDLSRVALVQ